MARPARYFLPDQPLHVIQRGNNRGQVFFTKQDAGDFLAWLKEAAAAGERYDLVLLDPPSFSNSKKMQGVLDVQRDHPRLVGQCHSLLADGGEL